MMKTKGFEKFTAAGVMALLLCMLAVMPAFAAIDPPMPEDGSVAGGIFVADGQSELAIEQAELVFDLSELLRDSYTDAQELLAYSAQVSATYTLYNPTNHTVTEQLATPISPYPYPSEQVPAGTDIEKFSVTINGTRITPQLRYAFTVGTGYYASTEGRPISDVHMPDFGLTYLSDTLLSRPVLVPDAPVYVYTYHAEVDEGEEEHLFYARADIYADPQSCALFTSWYTYDGNISENTIKVSRNVYISEDFTLCSVGQPLDTVEWRSETFKGEAVRASVVQTSVIEMTLYEYVMQGYDAQSGVTEQDYFNAFLAYTQKYQREESPVINLGEDSPLPAHNLQPWQLFSVELAPGERMSVTVTAPLYPSLNNRYNPPVYIYAFAMAQKEEWSAYGRTRMHLITEHYLSKQQRPMPKYDSYIETEDGYVWEGQADFPYLIFSTCESKYPSDGSTLVAMILTILIVLSLLAVFVLPWVIPGMVIILIVVLIVRRVKKNKKRRAASAQQTLGKEKEHEKGQENQE